MVITLVQITAIVAATSLAASAGRRHAWRRNQLGDVAARVAQSVLAALIAVSVTSAIASEHGLHIALVLIGVVLAAHGIVATVANPPGSAVRPWMSVRGIRYGAAFVAVFAIGSAPLAAAIDASQGTALGLLTANVGGALLLTTALLAAWEATVGSLASRLRPTSATRGAHAMWLHPGSDPGV